MGPVTGRSSGSRSCLPGTCGPMGRSVRACRTSAQRPSAGKPHRIFLSPETCSGGPEFDDPPVYASTCLADGKVFAGIYGDPRFIRAVLDGLRVESFSHPSS